MISVWFRACADRSTAVEVRHTLFPNEPMRARHQEGGSKGTLDRLGRLLALPEWPREEDQTSKTKNHVLTPIELLADASRSFCMCCAVGIEPNVERIKEHTENPLMLVTAFNPHVGHQKAAKISLTACRQHLSARAASLKFGFLTDEQFDLWVRVEELTHPYQVAEPIVEGRRSGTWLSYLRLSARP